MVEPVTLTLLIVSVTVSAIMAISGLLMIIKNGKDITDDLKDWAESVGKRSTVINKVQSLGSFIGVCCLFQDYKKKITCRDRQLITIKDKEGKDKTFKIPASGKYIELELKSGVKIVISVIGDNKYVNNPNVTGFKIYYKQRDHFREFAERALSKFISKENLEELLDSDNENGKHANKYKKVD
jgi:hypothetical protein